MLRKRRLLLLLIGVGMLVGVFMFCSVRQREPEYGGKGLSEWVAIYATPQAGRTLLSSNENPQAADAIRHIGTNAIPCLLRWMRYEPRLYPKLNAILASLNSSWYVSDARRARAIAAAWAFGALGEQAAPAIPELASIINCPNLDFSHRRIMAVVALNSLGRAGLPALLAAVTNQQTGFLRLSAVAHIEMLGTNAAPAVPVLQRLLMDSEPRMRVGATNALRRIDPVALEKAGARVEKVQ